MGLFGTASWEIVRDAKQAERAGALALGSSLLGTTATVSIAEDLPFLSATASEITANIASKKSGWNATRVLQAYVRSSLRAQEGFNPLTEVMYKEAFEMAAALDKNFAKTGIVGPLHGVPISLKDQIDVEGFDSTIGLTGEVGNPSLRDGVIVKVLKDAGAVPFVKTNVPQTLLAFECGNPVFGVTGNPYNGERTCGGSSGGEAALLASDASPIGIGSDVGGSLRIPAHFSGCFGLKPCLGRFPGSGVMPPNPGFDAIKSTLGPMGRSVDDLESITRVVVDASIALARTQHLIPLAYRKVTLPAKLKFGYYLTDGFCRASPACERAILETVAVLKKAGHEVVEFTPPSPTEAMEIFVALTSSGGYKALLKGVKNDPREASLFLTTLGVRLPGVVRKLAASVIHNVVGDTHMSTIISASALRSVTEMQEWQVRRDEFVAAFRELAWGTNAFDAILCAPQATPALKNGETWNLSPLAIGTILYNVVDTTAGVVPVTFVDPVIDAVTPEWLAKGQQGSPMVEDRVYGKNGVYDAVSMKGLPIGIQIVGAAWEEEKVIAIMRVVDTLLGPRGFGPGEYTKRKMEEK